MKKYVVILIMLISSIITGCYSANRMSQNRGSRFQLNGVYHVDFGGNVYGAPIVQLVIDQDSNFIYSITGDCYRKISHGKIYCSESGLLFESAIEDPYLFETTITGDSTQNNNKIELIMDSSFDSYQLNWFIASDEGAFERVVDSRHYQVPTSDMPVRFRLIGVINEQHCNTTTIRETVCSQSIVLDSPGVYSITTDGIFAKDPLNYIPMKGFVSMDKYGNLLWDDLYLIRRK